MELAIIGDPIFTLGFKLAGVRQTHEADAPPQLNEAVRRVMADPGIGVVVMQTPDVQHLDPHLRRELEASVRPTLVAIGLHEDSTLREKLKQAIGVDLWNQ